MILYGADVYYFPTIFTRYGNKGRSKLLAVGHAVKFKLHYGLQMVHVRNKNEENLNDFPLILLAPEMVYNLKGLSDPYLS